MTKTNVSSEITLPKNQLKLYGCDYYFNSFIQLYQKNKLPNTILLNGPKGSGKATFAYHFINYLLSYNEQNMYSVNNFSINPDNKSYRNLCNNIHPNFLLVENNIFEDNIKIQDIRDTLKFLNTSTYYSNIKIVLIDNAEYLNINSSNALLKELEEPNDNTFFFIINDSSNSISDTIKSRCIEFKFFFSLSDKKNILENILKHYKYVYDIKEFGSNFYYDTPGNILKLLNIFTDTQQNFQKDKLSCILYLIDKYKQRKDPQLLIFISTFVEYFYNELSLMNSNKLNTYFYNKFKILKQINDMRKFNLNKNNLFISLQGILENES